MRKILLVLILLSGCLAACDTPANPLPHALYYLAGPTAEDTQVWRLDADGVTTTQITHEAAGVHDFSVSPADGGLALISDNHLYLVDADGQNRRLIADDSQVDKEAEDYVHHGFISSPVFSPDGRTLAYAFDGLHLYDIATGEDQHVLKNLGNLLGEPFVYVLEDYYPGPWSPDGSKLLIEMGYFEGSTLAVMAPGKAQPFTRMRSDGPVCCLYNWAADGRSVLVANGTFGTNPPGLWRYDAETGEESVLLATRPGSEHFVGWPVQLLSGDLLYFHGEQFLPDVGVPLAMVRSDPDASNRTQLRPEVFDIWSALWAQDGSSAVIVRAGDEGGLQIVLARTDGSPLQVLVRAEGIRFLTWGP